MSGRHGEISRCLVFIVEQQRVRAVEQEEPDDITVAMGSRVHERCFVFFASRKNIRATGQQSIDHLRFALQGSDLQSLIERLTSERGQQPDQIDLAAVRGGRQSGPIFIRAHRGIGLGGQQGLDRLHAATASRSDQRRVKTRARHSRVRSMTSQKSHRLRSPVLRRTKQGRRSFRIRHIHRHARF